MISLHTFLSCANRKPPSKVICCLLCVLNFRSYHILKNFKLPFKIPQERERIHKFPIGRLPPSMVGNHWLRTCPPLFCLPLSQFFVFCFEGATATAGKSDHALTCYVMVQLRLCCNYRTYLGLTNCIKPSELSLFCCYFQGILAGSFTPEISLRNSCCRISSGKTH